MARTERAKLQERAKQAESNIRLRESLREHAIERALECAREARETGSEEALREAIRQRVIAEECDRGIERNRKELERLGAALAMSANCLK